jgi:hypothetical protein
MNALLARKAKSNLSLFLICRSLATGVSAHNGGAQDGRDFSSALARRHLFGGNEFDYFHERHRAVETPTNHESNLPKRWAT